MYSFLTHFPHFCAVSLFVHNCSNLEKLYFDVFICINITMRFIFNMCSYTVVNHKFLRNYIIHFIFLFQVCISAPYVKYILISCGDIKMNPGPKTTSDHNLSVCYWNLNGITTNNFIKKSLLEAYNTYDIICISGTFLNSDLSNDDSRLSLQGYELIRCDNPNDFYIFWDYFPNFFQLKKLLILFHSVLLLLIYYKISDVVIGYH